MTSLDAVAVQGPGPLGPSRPDPLTEQESEIAGRVWADFCEAKTERLALDDLWWVSWSWYRGRTDVFFERGLNRGDGRVYQVVFGTPIERRARPINLIGHTVDLTVAKHMKPRPTFDASPSTREPRDRLAARAARDLMRHIWLERDLTSARRMLYLDRVITGNAFLKCRYDEFLPPFVDNMQPCEGCAGAGSYMPPELGAEFEQASMQAMLVGAAAPPPPSPVMCPMCQGAGQTKEGRRPLGDVAVDIVSPWEIYPVAGARKVTDGVFHAHAITLDQASAKYGFSKEEIGGRGGFDEATPWFSKLARSRQIDGLKLKENQVWVVERWLPPLPGSEHPRLTILVGNRLAWPRPGVTPGWEQGWGEIAEPYGRIPIFHFRLRPAAEDFWSEGIVPDMISCNDFINRARASFHRHQQTMAYTKWMVEKGSVDEEALTNEEGEVVEYWGAEPPIQRSPAPMPEFYVRLAEKEEQNIPRLAGLQEVDQGKAPPNIEAFQALHFLAEQSETVQGPVLLEDECQWRAVARAVLVCAASNYDPTEQRMIRINGAGSKLEVEALLASDLSTNIDIQCEIGSALAHSQALRQEQVFRALESGIITPQEARRLAEFGIMLGENDGDHRLQESTAEQENQAMAQGQSHAVMLFAHDHDVHIAAHRRAALEAQIDGNLQLAHALDQAALHHIMAKQQAALQSAAPPAPQPQAPQPQSVPSPIPGAANAPFDSHQMPQQYEAAGMGITQ